ncbi:hypothetical protein [Candidatus Endoriftia persephone]|uniref:Type II secretion system protein GspC N-terminal domain-containing protein n=2 Tax=Gammaproteobacteria TaxID=1236 RepID=G2FI08_9GAMM|nr:hypothetical protein [Candidatus Endoriftia persephone]EGW53600.1 hypothetical protein TevJSym_ay00360 [endosymbiont of Tevnia jerichonana (vent Tica)]USF86956.1 hypothetical protein L0Y14_12545 [Candidatus Endoriftia persephone]
MNSISGRINILSLLLLLALAGLGKLLLLQWEDMERKQDDSRPVSTQANGVANTLKLPDSGAYTIPPRSAFREVLERPLFIEGRVAPQPEIRQVQPVVQARPSLQLEGVVIVNQRRIAVVREVRGNSVIRLQVGDNYSGWLVAEVARDRVVMRQNASHIELALDADQGGRSAIRRVEPPSADQK